MGAVRSPKLRFRYGSSALSFLARLTIALACLACTGTAPAWAATAPALSLTADLLVVEDGTSRPFTSVDMPTSREKLLLFTPAFGAATGAPDGYTEATVVGGVVTHIQSSGNSLIPADGYVMTAAGEPSWWLTNQIQVGSKVEIRLNEVTNTQQTMTRTIHGVNAAVRGADQFIVYTPEFSRRNTGTNAYGAEVVVEEGYVTSVGGNNSTIPSNGLVISGHGSAREWLEKNAPMGARVSLKGKEITIAVDADSYVHAAERAIEQLDSATLDAAAKLLDVPYPSLWNRLDELKRELAEAKASLARGDQKQAIHMAKNIQDAAALAANLTLPSQPAELRGVWHRPAERSPAEVAQVLDRLAASGVNAVFLETFYWGRTIYPSAVAHQTEAFVGWDPLEAWIQEGHKRGIEIHAWIHVFYVGGGGAVLLVEHPEWAAVERSVAKGAKATSTHQYADPAIPAVRQFLLTVYREMVERYPLDGLHLDHIRYPDTKDIESSYSYSAEARRLFQAETGIPVDPLTMTPGGTPTEWKSWTAWREEKVTSFVQGVEGAVRAMRPDLLISAAVLGNPLEAKNSVMQDWLGWLNSGLIEFVTPMLYTFDAGSVGRQTERLTTPSGFLSERYLSVSGIGPFLGLTPDATLDQTLAAKAAGSPGAVLFALWALGRPHFETLRTGPWRTDPIAPYRTLAAVDRILSDAQDRIDRLYAEALAGLRRATAQDVVNELRQWVPGQNQEVTRAPWGKPFQAGAGDGVKDDDAKAGDRSDGIRSRLASYERLESQLTALSTGMANVLIGPVEPREGRSGEPSPHELQLLAAIDRLQEQMADAARLLRFATRQMEL